MAKKAQPKKAAAKKPAPKKAAAKKSMAPAIVAGVAGAALGATLASSQEFGHGHGHDQSEE